MSVHVFLGPSLSLGAAREILPDAVYHPPVSMGDVAVLALRERPRAIALIDGLFECTPAVWHKEVLFALSRGVAVFGAASMGALRAAELCAYGMVGVGRVFEAYRDGAFEDDDEVAVIHGPPEDGCRVLSDAMVNLRHGLALAAEDGHISARTRDALVEEARAMFYPARSWTSVLARGRARGLPESELDGLGAFLKRARPDLKRDDAAALLTLLRDPRHIEAAAPRACFTFEPTTFWLRLLRTESARRGGLHTSPQGATP